MTKEMNSILNDFTEMSRELFQDHLKSVILYGSYARGDYHEGSDIDVMLLVDLNDSEIKQTGKLLSDRTFDINYDNDIMIMPMVQNIDTFNKWVHAHPFYNNVNNEGVRLYAG